MGPNPNQEVQNVNPNRSEVARQLKLHEVALAAEGTRTFTTVVRRPKWKRQLGPDGRPLPAVRDGDEWVRVRLDLDVAGLVEHLTPRARASRGQRSAMQGSLVVLTVTGADAVQAGGAS